MRKMLSPSVNGNPSQPTHSNNPTNPGFDPFKFSDKGDLAKFRVAELKHGAFRNRLSL
jgi:hypothetical protein